MSNEPSEYGLSKQVQSERIAAPDLPYLPPKPRRYRPRIGLVGAGGVTEYHLRAYQQLGLEVAMICDLDPRRAEARRVQFFPQAAVCSDFTQVLKNEEIEIIDAALHPEPRVGVIEGAIAAGKHGLSRQPFGL